MYCYYETKGFSKNKPGKSQDSDEWNYQLADLLSRHRFQKLTSYPKHAFDTDIRMSPLIKCGLEISNLVLKLIIKVFRICKRINIIESILAVICDDIYVSVNCSSNTILIIRRKSIEKQYSLIFFLYSKILTKMF